MDHPPPSDDKPAPPPPPFLLIMVSGSRTEGLACRWGSGGHGWLQCSEGKPQQSTVFRLCLHPRGVWGSTDLPRPLQQPPKTHSIPTLQARQPLPLLRGGPHLAALASGPDSCQGSNLCPRPHAVSLASKVAHKIRISHHFKTTKPTEKPRFLAALRNIKDLVMQDLHFFMLTQAAAAPGHGIRGPVSPWQLVPP